MSYETKTPVYKTEATATTNVLIRNVYIWMSIALLITGGTATLVANTPAFIEAIFTNRILFWGLLIAQFGIVMAISAKINSFSLNVVSGLFMLYSFLTGVTFSVFFYVYTAESIASTFFVTAGTFAAMSFYGYVTKKDLTKLGNLCMMALVGLIIASIVNLFWANSTLYWVTTYAGVLIFVGLIAYDTQKLKVLATMENNEQTQKLAICGALSLYLDVINLFLMLLRIMGNRK